MNLLMRSVNDFLHLQWIYFLKENILLLFSDIISSFVTSLLLNKFLYFNIYRREVGCYIDRLSSFCLLSSSLCLILHACLYSNCDCVLACSRMVCWSMLNFFEWYLNLHHHLAPIHNISLFEKLKIFKNLATWIDSKWFSVRFESTHDESIQ